MHLSKLVFNPEHEETRHLMGNAYLWHQWMVRIYPEGKHLYRLESENPPTVLVQSEKLPTTSDLPEGLLLSVQTKSFGFQTQQGKRYIFRLQMACNHRSQGKDVWVRDPQAQLQFVKERLEARGASILRMEIRNAADQLVVQPSKKNRFFDYHIRVEGVLEVKDPATFVEAVQGGIGRRKFLGNGLLSLMPVNP